MFYQRSLTLLTYLFEIPAKFLLNNILLLLTNYAKDNVVQDTACCSGLTCGKITSLQEVHWNSMKEVIDTNICFRTNDGKFKISIPCMCEAVENETNKCLH